MTGLSRTQIYLLIAFIIFLIFVIIDGRILNLINDSKCKDDENIKSGHKWAAWTVGLSSVFALASLIIFIILFFMKKESD